MSNEFRIRNFVGPCKSVGHAIEMFKKYIKEHLGEKIIIEHVDCAEITALKTELKRERGVVDEFCVDLSIVEDEEFLNKIKIAHEAQKKREVVIE